jgi:glyoxylase-like metal-dependent hydrolase (beta-lactamase superfamily II)
MLSILLVFTMALTIWGAHAAIDFNKVHLETEHVAGNVSMIKMVGGHASNIGVIGGDEGVLMVDSQYGRMTEKVVEQINKISNKPIRYLINTHYHGDHTDGNANFTNMGVTVVAHENVRKVMSTPRINIVTGKTDPAKPRNALPKVTYADNMEINLNNETIRIIHVPESHTRGDSFIHFVDSNVLQMGDTYRTTTYPVADPSDGGSYLGLIKVMAMAIEMSGPDTRIIPGHGYVSDVNDLKSLLTVMTTIRDRIRQLILQGKTVTEVIAAEPTAEFDQRWGFPEGHFLSVEKMLTMFYKELKAQ